MMTPVRREAPPRAGSGGFTLIELLVVLAVLAVLAAMVAPNYLDRVAHARETVLRHDLVTLRIAIDQFYRDKARYPATLEELAVQRYIREVPEDPLTRSRASWVLLPPSGVESGTGTGTAGVFDVKSGAPGLGGDGTPYASW